MDSMSTLKESLAQSDVEYDRVKDLKAFDETRSGVKGIVDSGIVKIPKFFIIPADVTDTIAKPANSNTVQVPVINLTGIESSEERKNIVSQVRRASKEFGFFQVVNHGISSNVLEGMLNGVRKFHEQDSEVKKEWYTQGVMQKVRYGSNIDLYRSKAANWRDSLTISLQVSDIEQDELPEICRESIFEYINEVTLLGGTLFELLSEALGLEPQYLGEMECAKGRTFIGHYYPSCPEPELTLGTSKHTDPSFLTVLLQDHIGGLQILHKDQYIDVPPIDGSLVINIGDMLQIISNDEFISMDHRVLANSRGPRISVACFFTGATVPERIYGPVKELILEEHPPRYKEFTVREYISKFFLRPIDKSGLEEFRL